MVESQSKIVVMGSCSRDVFFKLDRLPQIGETLNASGKEKSLGGKGMNQAVQCGRLGASVDFLCQVGQDADGDEILEYLKGHQVGTKFARRIEGVETGQAYILALKGGDNSIFIYGGTNTMHDEDMKELKEDWLEGIKGAKYLLLQREVPEFLNVLAAKAAKANDVTVILDMGGRDEPLTEDLIKNCDIISPNETELQRLIARKLADESYETIKAEIHTFLTANSHLKILQKLGDKGACLFSLGSDGTLNETFRAAVKFSDHPDLQLVDTTGAGDCFTGSYAYKIAQGADEGDAIQFACQVAFLCLTKFGAGPSIPSYADWEKRFK